MTRDLPALSGRTFDVVVVGGGITGACIARDASRRGLSVALVDKGDFSGATSAGSSRLVHGGLRYLRNLEIGLVRESLRERRVWQRIAPHQVRPLPFLLPVHARVERLRSRVGLRLYDLLSFDRRWLDDPAQRIPASGWVPRGELLQLEPVLDRPHLLGAVAYGDCQMESPERLGLECVLDAVAHGACAANHVEVHAFVDGGDRLAAADARDVLTGNSLRIAGRVFVNATGPWADFMLAGLPGGAPTRRLVRSKGIHIVVPALTRTHALLLAHGTGHFFVIPWRGLTLVGTTDVPFSGSPDDVHAEPQEVRAFVDVVNAALPHAGLSTGDVLHAYAALRPLIADGGGSSYQMSRRGEVVDHAGEPGRRNLFSALGGKWTTSRATAEACVDRIVRSLRRGRVPCVTATEPLPGGRDADAGEFTQASARLHLEQAVSDNLRRTYGAMGLEVLRLAEADPALARRVTPGLPVIEAQAIHAVRAEMALTLDDVVSRRIGLTSVGPLEHDALTRVATLVGRERGWSAREVEAQVADVTRRSRPTGVQAPGC